MHMPKLSTSCQSIVQFIVQFIVQSEVQSMVQVLHQPLYKYFFQLLIFSRHDSHCLYQQLATALLVELVLVECRENLATGVKSKWILHV